ncbi:MAG: hypothetical protein ACI814_001120 [Mariniblastus sp.]
MTANAKTPMSKRKPKSKTIATNAPPVEPVATSADPSPQVESTIEFEWSSTTRRIVSVALLGFLAIVVLGPLSNPLGSAYFSIPLAKAVAPVHQALFLGHGYRFFGPDPGPSHRILFQGTREDGSTFQGHFPNRDENWPRLMYHRWFMLSETLFNEWALMPTKEQFTQVEAEYDRQIEILKTEGKPLLLQQLENERQLDQQFYADIRERVELLASTVARDLLEHNDGTSIELFTQERQIPFPAEVEDGQKLNDIRLLSVPQKIGELDSHGFRFAPKPEQLPAQMQEEVQ